MLCFIYLSFTDFYSTGLSIIFPGCVSLCLICTLHQFHEYQKNKKKNEKNNAKTQNDSRSPSWDNDFISRQHPVMSVIYGLNRIQTIRNQYHKKYHNFLKHSKIPTLGQLRLCLCMAHHTHLHKKTLISFFLRNLSTC